MRIVATLVLAAEIATTDSAAKESNAIGDVEGNVVAPSNEPSSAFLPSTSMEILNQGCAKTISARSCGAKAIDKALGLLIDHSHFVRSGNRG
jgi:hypothetical protein